jgi:hypothetical protein
MEELIEYRRQRGTSGQWKSHEMPVVKMTTDKGEFVFFKKTMELIGANHNEAIMFKFNRKDKCAYVYKEEPQDDSYYLRYNKREYSRFTSKDLMLFFCEIFSIEDEKNVYFKVESAENKLFKLTLHETI